MPRVHRLARAAFPVVSLVALVAAAAAWTVAALPARADAGPAGVGQQDSVRPPKEIHVTARKYSFSPQRIEVQENDLVKVTMETADIPHSFTIDDDSYRIAKRAVPGHPAVFEFRADKAGTFPFYCNLSADPGCKGMRGELVVKPKR